MKWFMMLKQLNKSIFRRLLFSYMFTVIFGLGVVGILISFFVKGYIYDTKQEELLRMAKKVNISIQEIPVIDPPTEQLILFFDQMFNARIWIFDRDGNIISTSTKDEVSIGKSVDSSIVEKVVNGENAVGKLHFVGLTESMLSVVVPWGKENSVYGGIVLHSSLSGLKDAVSSVRETILWGILLGVIITTAMVSYLSWSISRPLQKIDRAAAEIGLGNYANRINIDSVDEIGDLANTINSMAAKLEIIEHEREKQDQIRTGFLANSSHELRTPLTAIQGFLEALQDGLIDEGGRQRYYDIMYGETIHMNRLLDDIMDVIKLKNKDVVLTKQPIDVEPLLHRIVFKLRSKADDKGVDIRVKTSEDLPKAYADQDRLEQIMSNIIKNAIKFTDEGYIAILIEPDNSDIRFTFRDTGAGISESDQELIWERFFKVDRGRSKKDQGTGLGLAIVKELVELHDGKITVESELGKGTTFNVWIPSISN